MESIISINSLSKTYASGLHALKDVDLDIQRGEILALLGPNGAGKTTLISIICGIVNPTSGSVLVDGHDIITDFRAARSLIGLVPQELGIATFESVLATMAFSRGLFGKPHNADYIEGVLRDLSLWDKRDEKIMTLSGGMKRRLMIARSLMHEPRLLILDEPTAGVDIEIRRSMWRFLRELNQRGTTIILTTHYLEEAESLCRNIGIIDEGELIENTSMKQLLSQLDMETFVLDTRSPVGDAPELCPDCVRKIDDNTLEADILRDHSINFVFDELSKYGIEILSMRNKTNRLEQLFMHMVESDNPSVEQK